jgi:hypothetical protein
MTYAIVWEKFCVPCSLHTIIYFTDVLDIEVPLQIYARDTAFDFEIDTL